MRAQNLDFGFFKNPGKSARESQTAWLTISEDPYVYWDLFGDPEEIQPSAKCNSAATAPQALDVLKMSKRDFRNFCRRIFAQYIPPAQGQVLRPAYRDFILRNENRLPEARWRIADELGRYDLAESGNLRPHFNREREMLTEAKLREIEKKALSK